MTPPDPLLRHNAGEFCKELRIEFSTRDPALQRPAAPGSAMSRRSARLMMSGYYRNQDDDKTNISYHETPVRRIFNKKMGPQRSHGSSLNVSQASSSRSSFTEELIPGLGPALLSATQGAEPSFTFHVPTVVPPCSGFGACAAAVPPENAHFRRGGILAVIARFLLDALMLSRRPVLTTTLLTFLLTLAFGFCFYPTTLGNVSAISSPMKTTQTPLFTIIQKEVALLKVESWKQEQMIETLKNQLTDFKSTMTIEDLDLRMRFEKQTAGVHDQLLKLKDNVSSLYIDTMKKHLRSQKQENEKLKAGLSSWLQKQLESASASQRSIVQHAELQGALKELERKLVDYLRTEMEKERPELWRNGKGILQREGVGGLTIQDVHYTVKRALHVFKADGVGMADYALESIGSTIIQSRCSDSYQRHYAVFSLFGIPIFYLPGKPSTIIQPEVLAGKCWAFKGDQGFTTISLAHPVRITHVTLDHLPKELSPTGHIYNAPKEFSVYGMKDELEQDGALLGTFVFDYDREAVQTFELPADVRGVYRVVQLRVESNWGHPEYTCIYRFRVHGQLGAPLTPDLQHHP